MKDYVRLELVRRDKQPSGLQELIYLSVSINNRLYEYKIDTRRQERQDKPKKNKGRRREDRGNLIKLDNTKKKIQNKKGKLSLEEKKHRRNNNLCYSCGKEGYRVNKCKKNLNKGKP